VVGSYVRQGRLALLLKEKQNSGRAATRNVVGLYVRQGRLALLLKREAERRATCSSLEREAERRASALLLKEKQNGGRASAVGVEAVL
jgi:hypothetical protein